MESRTALAKAIGEFESSLKEDDNHSKQLITRLKSDLSSIKHGIGSMHTRHLAKGNVGAAFAQLNELSSEFELIKGVMSSYDKLAIYSANNDLPKIKKLLEARQYMTANKILVAANKSAALSTNPAGMFAQSDKKAEPRPSQQPDNEKKPGGP